MSRALSALGLVLVFGAVSGLHAQNPLPSNPRNRLTPIPEDRMTPALEQALAEYKRVRPDGLNPGRSGGPGLWSVYVHLPEILTPLRQLHEQVHVNPRLSQKLVHFIILITARHWTNDIWTAHDEDGIREGLTRETVKALEEGRHPKEMPDDEQIIYAFCTELLANKRVSDATYQRALSMFGEEGVVQTAVTVGLYSYLSLAVNMAYPETAGRGRLAPFPQ
jgi:4-carboxymuconolactone decarboxylase